MNRLFQIDTKLSELSVTQFKLFVSPSGGMLLLLYSSRTAGWSYAQPRLWSVGHGMRYAEKKKRKKKKKRKEKERKNK